MHRLLQQRVVDLPGGLDSSELTSRLAEHAGQGAEDEKEAVVADVAPAGVRGEVLDPLGQQYNLVFLCFSSWVKPYKTGWVRLGWVFCD